MNQEDKRTKTVFFLSCLAHFLKQTSFLFCSSILIFILLSVAFPLLVGDLPTLDIKWQGYSLEDVSATLSTCGVQGRVRYYWVNACLDTLLPILYTGLLVGLLLKGKDHQSHPPRHGLIGMALLPGILDLAENALIRELIVTFPNLSPKVVSWASSLTCSKYLFLCIASLLVMKPFLRRRV